MRKIHYLFIFILAGVGIALSVLLVPGKGELALIHFKDKEYEVARRSYEERLAVGDRSIDVVIPLTQLYLQFGEVDKAVHLMEEFVRGNPNDLAALQRLGKFFQYAERPRDYLKILERITALDPTESHLRELSSTYNFTGQYAKQIVVLKVLIDKYPMNPQDYIDLANLQASNGSIAEAAHTMQRFESLHQSDRTEQTTELHLNLLLDSNQAQSAYETAMRWLQADSTDATIVRFAELFNFKKQPALALRIVTPYEKEADTHPNVLQALVQMYISNGKSDTAYERLSELHRAGRLPGIAAEQLVDLALQRHETDLAIAVGEQYDLATLPPWLLSNLAEAALDARQTAFLARIVSRLGEQFLQDRPVLGARLAVARNDGSSALQWIARAERSTNLETLQHLALGDLYLRLNQQSDALRVYQAVALRADAPDYLFPELASLYLESHRAQEGLALMEGLNPMRRSLQVETAWALLATAAAQGDRVLPWLRNNASRLSLQALTDLYFAATEGGQDLVALAAAEPLYQQRKGRPDQLHLASALLKTSKPVEALKYLRPVVADTANVATTEHSDAEEMYLAALNGAVRLGEPVGDELKKFWSKRLAQNGLPDQKRQEVVYALLDLNDYSAALPTMEQFAREDTQWLYAFADASIRAGRQPQLVQFLENGLRRHDLDLKAREIHLRLLMEHGGSGSALPFLRQLADEGIADWPQVYEDALVRLDRKRELKSFLQERANRKDVADVERNSIASRLLELGDKPSAEAILLQLAATSAPDSSAVAQLLFLWGPRPGKAGLDWLQARGRAAKGSERAAWMHHLTNAGAPNLAAPLGEGSPDRSVHEEYVGALVAQSDKAALAPALRTSILREADPAALRRFGHIAVESGMNEIGRLVFEKLLQVRPEDPESLKRLGAMALWDGNFSTARQLLNHLMSRGTADYETHFYMGEVLNHDHDRGARLEYQRALDLLEASKNDAVEASIMRAQLLQRLGRTAEALARFKALMTERPADRNVQNEYVAALLQLGRYEDANRISAK